MGVASGAEMSESGKSKKLKWPPENLTALLLLVSSNHGVILLDKLMISLLESMCFLRFPYPSQETVHSLRYQNTTDLSKLKPGNQRLNKSLLDTSVLMRFNVLKSTCHKPRLATSEARHLDDPEPRKRMLPEI